MYLDLTNWKFEFMKCKSFNWSTITVYTLLVVSVLIIFVGLLSFNERVSELSNRILEMEIVLKDNVEVSNAVTYADKMDDYAKDLEMKSIAVNLYIAIIGIVLTFAAFYVQYLFNERQKKDITKERFENQYFHLLDVYRNICLNTFLLNVGQGKIVFHYMFYEYKAMYLLIKMYLEKNIPEVVWNAERLNHIVFTFFINGVSKDILPTFNDEHVNDYHKKAIIAMFFKFQEGSENYKKGMNDEDVIKYMSDYKHRNIKYFDGHRQRLIPYYKYIFIIFEYLKVTKEEQYDVKIAPIEYLLSEMTDHEIGLIYAYCKYVIYKGMSDKTNNFMSKETLFNRMYEALPIHMAYKFKFDDKNFLN